jgi:hypothetical protein
MSLFSPPVNKSFTLLRVLPTIPLVVLPAAKFTNSNVTPTETDLNGSHVKRTGLYVPGVEKLRKYPLSPPATSLFTAKIVTSQPERVFKLGKTALSGDIKIYMAAS